MGLFTKYGIYASQVVAGERIFSLGTPVNVISAPVNYAVMSVAMLESGKALLAYCNNSGNIELRVASYTGSSITLETATTITGVSSATVACEVVAVSSTVAFVAYATASATYLSKVTISGTSVSYSQMTATMETCSDSLSMCVLSSSRLLVMTEEADSEVYLINASLSTPTILDNASISVDEKQSNSTPTGRHIARVSDTEAIVVTGEVDCDAFYLDLTSDTVAVDDTEEINGGSLTSRNSRVVLRNSTKGFVLETATSDAGTHIRPFDYSSSTDTITGDSVEDVYNANCNAREPDVISVGNDEYLFIWEEDDSGTQNYGKYCKITFSGDTASFGSISTFLSVYVYRQRISEMGSDYHAMLFYYDYTNDNLNVMMWYNVDKIS